MVQAERHRETTRRVSLRIAAAALAVGGLSASTIIAGTASAVPNHKAKPVVISTATNAKLGTILVSGKTLYVLNKADCTGQCLKYWPEVLLPKGVKKAMAGTGVSAVKLGTVKLGGGVLQVTYSGRALYRFSGDKAAGEINGNGVKDTWGTWSVVVTAELANNSPSPTSGTPTTPTTSPIAGRSPATTSPPTTTTPPATTTTPSTSPTTTTTAPTSGGTGF
jgi:predicted lipoprotein with Yx(FWY)xxD motif